jgi:hypothetical protein
MQREHAIRQLAKLEGYRLEKKGDDSYRLINARFNVAVYHHDGVPLEKIAEFLERRIDVPMMEVVCGWSLKPHTISAVT